MFVLVGHIPIPTMAMGSTPDPPIKGRPFISRRDVLTSGGDIVDELHVVTVWISEKLERFETKNSDEVIWKLKRVCLYKVWMLSSDVEVDITLLPLDSPSSPPHTAHARSLQPTCSANRTCSAHSLADSRPGYTYSEQLILPTAGGTLQIQGWQRRNITKVGLDRCLVDIISPMPWVVSWKQVRGDDLNHIKG